MNTVRLAEVLLADIVKPSDLSGKNQYSPGFPHGRLSIQETTQIGDIAGID